MTTIYPQRTPLLAILLCLACVTIAAAQPASFPPAQALTALDPTNLQLSPISRIEGTISALDKEGDILAVSGRNSLTFYDLADPARPRALSTLTLPEHGRAVQLEDDLAYATWGSCEETIGSGCAGGLDVYDLGMPTAPIRLARLTGLEIMSSLAILGDTGYAITSSGSGELYRLDLRTPARPVLHPYGKGAPFTLLEVVERPDLGGRRFGYGSTIGGVMVIDLATGDWSNVTVVPNAQGPVTDSATVTTMDGRHLLYLSDGEQGIHVVDLTDPTSPRVGAMIDLPKVASVEMGEGMLFASTGDDAPGGGRLYTLSLEDPDAPRVVSQSLAGAHRFLSVVDGRLIATRNQTELVNYDLATPSAPRLVGAIPLLATSAGAYAHGHLFILGPSGDLIAVDLRRPAAPRSSATGIRTSAGASAVLVTAGDYLVFGTVAEGWRLLDIADPTRPLLLSRITLPAGHGPTTAALDLTASAPTAYLVSDCLDFADTCEAPARLTLYDLADPGRPGPLGRLSLARNSRLAAGAGFMYLASSDPSIGAPPAGGGRLTVVDVRNRAAPRSLGSVGFTGAPQDLAVTPGRVYVAAWWGGLHTIAVDNPDQPRLLSSFISHPTMQASSIVADGAAVFVATLYASELYTIDLGDASKPRLVERFKLPGTSSMLHLVGDQLVTVGSGVAIYRRGGAVDGTVRDTRGAPMTDVGLQIAGGAGLLSIGGPFTSQGTDLMGGLSLDRAGQAVLTPSFRGSAFWPPSRPVGSTGPLDFVMVGAPVSAAIQPGAATTLTMTDTQGLASSLSIPADGLTVATALTLRPLAPVQGGLLQIAGQSFALSLADEEASFARPALLTMRYSRADVRLISNLDALGLYRRVGDQWVPAAEGCAGAPPDVHNKASRELQVALCAPGEYALMGPTERVYLPLVTR